MANHKLNARFIEYLYNFDGDMEKLNGFLNNPKIDIHYNEDTPLKIAIKNNHTDLADVLLQKGDIDCNSEYFQQLLYKVILDGIKENLNIQRIRDIFQTYPSAVDLINSEMLECTIDSVTPNLPVLKLLVELSRKPELITDNFIALSITGGNFEMVKYLAETYPDTNQYIDDLIDHGKYLGYCDHVVTFLENMKRAKGW
jgi:ankyrin repeat protein